MKKRYGSVPGIRLAFCLVLAAVSIVGITGCGKNQTQTPKISTIDGKVLLPSGKPVPGGKLVLCPETALQPDGRRLSADLGKDGSFTITSSEDQPIFAGRYKVFVVVTGDPKLRSLRKSIPEKYQNISDDDSDLFIDLGEGGTSLSVKLAKS